MDIFMLFAFLLTQFYIVHMYEQCCGAVPFWPGSGSAPASQDGGSGSSSSPVVHNLLLKTKFLQISLLNLPGLVLFKERYECFALLIQYCI